MNKASLFGDDAVIVSDPNAVLGNPRAQVASAGEVLAQTGLGFWIQALELVPLHVLEHKPKSGVLEVLHLDDGVNQYREGVLDLSDDDLLIHRCVVDVIVVNHPAAPAALDCELERGLVSPIASLLDLPDQSLKDLSGVTVTLFCASYLDAREHLQLLANYLVNRARNLVKGQTGAIDAGHLRG